MSEGYLEYEKKDDIYLQIIRLLIISRVRDIIEDGAHRKLTACSGSKRFTLEPKRPTFEPHDLTRFTNHRPSIIEYLGIVQSTTSDTPHTTLSGTRAATIVRFISLTTFAPAQNTLRTLDREICRGQTGNRL
jgi:hypothetical protein